MSDYGVFKYGGASYPLPTALANPLLFDADPSLYYVLDYFQSMLRTYMGPRLLAEAQKSPALAGVATNQPYVVPYDPTPFLNEQQFKFPLLAVYRKKDKFIWKTIAVMDDASEWCVDYILPPLTSGQMERVAPILRTVGVILQSRIENMFDPNYRGGLEVWKAAGLEEIYLQEAEYGAFPATGNLVFPAWRGKLVVKENQFFEAGLSALGGIDQNVLVIDSNGSVIQVEGLSFVATTQNFLSGFSMQVAKLPLTVPLVATAPGNTSEPEQTGIFFPGTFQLQIDGTFTGTFVLEGSVDGVTFYDITAQLVGAPSTLTTTGLYRMATATPPYVRVRCTLAVSGAPTMQISGII